MVDVGRDPQPVAVPMVDGNGECAAASAEHSRGRRLDLPKSFRVGIGVRPPWVNGSVGQLFWAVADDFGERGVHLEDGTLIVADKEPFLQGIHQSAAPAGLMVA